MSYTAGTKSDVLANVPADGAMVQEGIFLIKEQVGKGKIRGLYCVEK